MKALVAIAVGVAVLILALVRSVTAGDLHIPGDPYPAPALAGGDPCASDTWCSDRTLEAGFIADGEWNPTTMLSGFVTTNNTIVVIDGLCAVMSETAITGPDFPGPVTRGFAWGIGDGDSWVGSWLVTDAPGPRLYHLDATFAVVSADSITDPGTGSGMQFSGLAMDTQRGHLWGILRNNPAGTLSRFVELDIHVSPPAILQGPFDVPWPGGASAVGSAGLEYNSQDCTLLALRQDANNLGDTHLVVFQDLDPGRARGAAGGGGVTLLGECSIANTPCTGAGMGSNRPWGISLVENVPYGIYSDLNLPVGCTGTIEQPGDFHIIGLPMATGMCVMPTEESSWGRIKSIYLGPSRR